MTYARVKLGSVRVRVRDIARSEAFYTTTLGLEVSERVGAHVFLSAGDEHHVLALEGVGIEPGGVSPHVGMSSIGWEVSNAWEFWRMHRQLETSRVKFTAEDDGVRWTLRLNDPDGNAIEIYVDSRALPGGREAWGGTTVPVDQTHILAALQAEVPGIGEYDG